MRPIIAATRSEEDFALMEVIAAHLYEKYPLFAQVRENIRR